MTGQDESRYVPVAEAAVLLGVKPDSVRKAIRRRKLQAIKTPDSGQWLVLIDGTDPAPTTTKTGHDSGQAIVPVVVLPESPVLGGWDALRGYHDAVVAGLLQVVAHRDDQHAAIMAELAAVRAEVAALRDSTRLEQDTTRDGTWWSRLALWRRR